jgi:hypothetical protein
MSGLGRARNALGVVLYTVVQVHGDSACFAAPATALGADSSIMRPWVFGVLENYAMTWTEAQQVVNALVDANGEVVMSAWHGANVLGDSGPTPRLSFEDQ